jgi:predicted porin
MNKKILAATIAAFVAGPTAALAANDVTVYGVVHASVDYRSEDDSKVNLNVFNPNTGSYEHVDLGRFGKSLLRPGDASDGWDVASRATRLGFKGSEDLANGLKAIWKMELQVDIADQGGSCLPAIDSPGTPFVTGIGSLQSPTVNQGGAGGSCSSADFITARNAYVGLAGGFGTFLVGRHDTPYKMSTASLDLFADTLADNNSTIGLVDIRTNSAIAYVSPSWGGFTLSGAIVTPHQYSRGFYTDANGDTYAKTADADGLAEAYSLAAVYNANGFFASAAYESISGTWWDAVTGGGLSAGRSWDDRYSYNSKDEQKVRVGLGFTGGGFTVGGIYEWNDDMLGVSGADGERWQISAGYTFGNNMIKAMYGQGDYSYSGSFAWQFDPRDTGTFSSEADQSAWAIGLDHNLSKRTKAYVLYTAVSGDSDIRDAEYFTDVTGRVQTSGSKEKVDYDWGGFSIGMVHSF